VKPLELAPNQLGRFYRGGRRIAAFRGLPPAGDDAPEDWIASTAHARGDPQLGPSRVGGRPLADVLAADPEAFFDPEHLERFGPEPAVLLKLLDAGERLPLHFHPDGAFAQRHLGELRGKTEAWIFLAAEPAATVHVGFAHDVSADEVSALVAAEDVDGLVSAMNPLPVEPGDAIFVPAGVPHVIGEGILLLELQEPSDLSVLLEWRGIVDEANAFLGLPRDLALGALDRSRTDVDRLKESRGDVYFPAAADAFFRAERVRGGTTLEPSFSVLIVTSGEGELETERGGSLPLRRGSTVLVPFAAGNVRVTGECEAIRCRAPAPSAA
jgi:mannose-6-phosphate isomerase